MPEQKREGVWVEQAGAEPVLQAGTVVGHYRIIGFIAEGSMGRVYEVEHVTLRSRHALKVILQRYAADERFVKSFRREARLMANLQHPNITHVTDYGVEQGLCYFVMEYVAGADGKWMTLEDRLGGSGPMTPLPAAEILSIFSQIADALVYCHRFDGKGVIHRDLKPSNILLRPGEGGRDHVVISDFGIAQICSDMACLSTVEAVPGGAVPADIQGVSGTPAYMSPEQWQVGNAAGPESDLFAVGVMLYQALTGAMPFQDSRALMGSHPPAIKKPSAFGRSRGWDRLVMRCLSVTPARRYHDAADFLRDLGALSRPRLPRVRLALVGSLLLGVCLAWGWPWIRGLAARPEADVGATEPLPVSSEPVPMAPLRGAVPVRTEPFPVSVQIRIAPGHALPYALPVQGELQVDQGVWHVVTLPHVVSLPGGKPSRLRLRVAGYEEPPPLVLDPAADGTRQFFDLVPLPARIKVTSNAAHAEVLEGEVRLGRVGEVLALAPFRDHRLLIHSPRHKEQVLTIRRPEPTIGEPLVMSVDLVPIPGRLRIDAMGADGYHPGKRADIYVDGHLVGHELLPFVMQNLTQETVRVALDVKGFKPTQPREVTLEPNQVVSVDFVLEYQEAWLTFDVEPADSMILLSGKRVQGDRVKVVPDLLYNVRFVSEEYWPVDQKVALTAGETRVVSARLTPRCYLRMDLQPTNAVVFMSGRRITDRIIEVEPGRFYAVEVRASGYQTETTNIWLETGESRTVSISLRKKLFGL
ncbi:MAG: protein kinase [Kiritimatiellae bacterium]|nr:protein kinase [Kiritimatiellia bacterium]